MVNNATVQNILKVIGNTSFNEKLVIGSLERLSTFNLYISEYEYFLFAFSIQKVESYIKNSCNTDCVPNGLLEVAVERVCGEVLFTKMQTGELGDSFDFENAIKSLKMGDTEITYSDKNISEEEKVLSLINTLKESGKGELVRFRKMKW
ncbi:MAG: hypothetical protein ACK5LY_06850 [Lachnospirales bacterium]